MKPSLLAVQVGGLAFPEEMSELFIHRHTAISLVASTLRAKHLEIPQPSDRRLLVFFGVSMTNKNDIGAILDIPSERVDEFIDLCYEKMNALEKNDLAIAAIVKYMLSLGTDSKEQFLAGFILGRVYSMNISSAEEAEQFARMFS